MSRRCPPGKYYNSRTGRCHPITPPDIAEARARHKAEHPIQTTETLFRVEEVRSSKTRCKRCGKVIGFGKKCMVVGADGYKVSLDMECAKKSLGEITEKVEEL